MDKKSKKRKKLILDKDTVRSITDDQLKEAAGGEFILHREKCTAGGLCYETDGSW